MTKAPTAKPKRGRKVTAVIMPKSAMMNMPASPGRISERERRYRAEDALRTLSEAERIKGDKGLMRDVRAHHRRLGKAIGKEPKGAT